MSDAPHPSSTTAPTPKEIPPAAAQPLDFRASSLLSPLQLRKLRTHQEPFLNALSSRVSMFLRSEFPLKLNSIQVLSYQKLTGGWAAPCHLTLFKAEPLRGVSILQMSLPLSFAIVDRLMGGTGKVEPSERQISEIEKALLDQIVQIVVEEWCNNWAPLRQLKPALLGCESSGRFLQTAPPQTNMLVLGIDAQTGDCTGQIQLAVPYTALEPLLRQLCPGAEPSAESPVPAAAPLPKWNPCLEDVPLHVTAQWHGMEIPARDVLHLKVGDVLQVSLQLAQQVCVRVGELSKFNGRLGTAGGNWAVELTQVLKS
ncbi:MAG: flagellar motor switch protein FliM [Verrucomicrobiota bacterium]|jgi:flagellar motor switch protein FliM